VPKKVRRPQLIHCIGVTFLRPENADLHAALAAEPDNPEAKALLHQRSVNVEKVRVLAFLFLCCVQ